MAFTDMFKNLGFEKVRRALALLSLSFFVSFYLLLTLVAPPEQRPMFFALLGCYFVAFLALASEWFWARWFASGLGWSGLMVGVLSLLQIGWHPILAMYGGLHGIVVAALLGEKMAGLYDMQEGWRIRFGMDEFGVARLRKTVTRAAASLPTLIVMVLGPREGQGFALAAFAAALIAIAGLTAVLRMRTWGLLAIGASSVMISLLGGLGTAPSASFGTNQPFTFFSVTSLAPSIVALLLAFAVLPFARPALAFLQRRR